MMLNGIILFNKHNSGGPHCNGDLLRIFESTNKEGEFSGISTWCQVWIYGFIVRPPQIGICRYACGVLSWTTVALHGLWIRRARNARCFKGHVEVMMYHWFPLELAARTLQTILTYPNEWRIQDTDRKTQVFRCVIVLPFVARLLNQKPPASLKFMPHYPFDT